MEHLKEIPFNQPIDGVPIPTVARPRSSVLEDLLLDLKVGQCLRVQNHKELQRARWYARKHKIPVLCRAVGDGSYVLWRRRKNGKSA